MYGLRHINNNFKEHAGSRSDFIILGHPEFQDGKVRSELKGMDRNKWDTERRTVPGSHVARTEPIRLGRKSRSAAELVHNVSFPEPRPSFQDRAKQRPDRGVVKIEQPPGRDFNEFLAQLTAPEDSSAALSTHTQSGTVNFSHQRCRSHMKPEEMTPAMARTAPMRNTHTYANSLGWAHTCRHYAGVHDELLELRQKYIANPEKAVRELLRADTWRYYASHLQQAQRLEKSFEKERRQKAAHIQAMHDIPVPSGASHLGRVA